MEKNNTEDEIPYIYGWRKRNKARYLEISRAGSAKYYELNREKKKAYALEYYYRKKKEEKASQKKDSVQQE